MGNLSVELFCATEAIFMPRRTIVVGYIGFRLDVQVSVRPSSTSIHPSVQFLFLDDNLSKHQWIFMKLGMCIDIVEIWFGIVNGQISSVFLRSYLPATRQWQGIIV